MASIVIKRKEQLNTTYNDRRNNSGNTRGYTTDHQISIEASLRKQKLLYIHNANESDLIAVVGHALAISKQGRGGEESCNLLYRIQYFESLFETN